MSLAHLAATVTRLGGGPVVVTRRAAPVLDGHGRAIESPGSKFTVHGSVQPASGRDLLRLEEGQRTKEVVVLFSPLELRTASAPKGTPADTFEWRDGTFEVQAVERWAELGDYWRVLASKQGQ